MMKQVNFRIPCRVFALLLGLFLSVGAFAQNIVVKGHVKDATGETIIGASVKVAGTNTGTVTDFDGNFTLNVKKGATLIISYIGYSSKTIQAAPNVTVILEEDQKVLKEIVAIGYGRVKKSDVTGSITAIKPDELSKGITNNATDMLIGKIAGVDVITSGGAPGSGAQIRIRGGSSLNASNDPLLVVDGLTIDNNTAKGMSNVLAMINPNDIETFTVLKDASATAIYGSRASNGVILITTKKGKKDTKPSISYNGNVTVSHTQKRYDVMDGNEYRDLVTKVMGAESAANLGTANTDWQDEIFRTSISSDHNISISGGIKNIPYRISAGYNAEDGIIKTSEMRRTNVGINLNPSLLNDHLNINITAKYMYETDNYVDNVAAVGAALAMDPTRPVYGTGDQYTFTGGYYQSLISANFSDPSWLYTINKNATQNPLALLYNDSKKAHSSDFTGNIEFDYKIHGFEDLHIHGSLGGEYTEGSQADYNTPYSYDNNYYGWDGQTRTYKYNIIGNIYAQYIHTFGIHYIDFMAGAEESHYHRNGSNWGQGTDPYLNTAYNESLKSQNAWATRSTLLSYFGRFNYTLAERYMVTTTLRGDASSRFSKNNRWGFFPSVGLAWKINEEKFMKSLSWWNEFKLRMGWGQTGQQQLKDASGNDLDFAYVPLYVISNSNAEYPFGSTYYQTVRPNSFNPDLKWETTTTWNAGIDLGFLNNRITANVDGYYRKTKDLLNFVSIPIGTNFGSSLPENIGSLKNYGIEFSIEARPIVSKDFTWTVAYNLSWNHNEVTKLLNGADDDYVVYNYNNKISKGNNTPIEVFKVGSPINAFYVYQQVYDKDGKPIEGVYVDRNGDGKINSSDKYIYKSPAADVYMGLTSKFIYKEWDFSFSLRAALNNYVYYDFLSDRAAISSSGLYSNSAFRNTTNEAVKLGFTGTGSSEYYLSDYFVRNASYLKCSNITLGYTFPALVKTTSYTGLSGRVFATVQNPFIITKYDGLDPEVSSGVDRSPYPRPISFQLGVNLNF
jgi:TonB-dependent starch-binding outer membrane protein SusC